MTLVGFATDAQHAKSQNYRRGHVNGLLLVSALRISHGTPKMSPALQIISDKHLCKQNLLLKSIDCAVKQVWQNLSCYMGL